MADVRNLKELHARLHLPRPQFMELWVELPDGQSICALINGELGWLMYLREAGDSGFSSRNPDYCGASDAEIDYYLENGQHDKYPAAWAIPVSEIKRVLDDFLMNSKPPTWLVWHNDSEDGTVIEAGD